MIKDFLFSIRDYAVFTGSTEQTARNRLEEMVRNGQAEKIKPPSAPHLYRIVAPMISASDPFNLIDRPDAPRIDDVDAWMFGANISGTCYDPRKEVSE